MAFNVPNIPRTEAEREIMYWRQNVRNCLLMIVNLPAYANNAAALAGGLVAGDFYRTGGDPDVVCVVSP